MHIGLLAAWTGLSIQGGDTWGWLLGLIIVGWLGIRWWSARIAQQFERDSPPESEAVKRQATGTDWQVGGLLKLLLGLFLLAMALLISFL
jgi:hypothetical protein